jgi:uncharacterized membrane-anchored protein YhcB (DUF1043 family)
MKDKRPSVRITQGVYDRLTRLKRQLGLSYTDTIRHLLNHFPEYTEQQRLILKAFTLTATLFDRLLQAYPGLRADMKDDLTELWACIDEIKAHWATKPRTPKTNHEN